MTWHWGPAVPAFQRALRVLHKPLGLFREAPEDDYAYLLGSYILTEQNSHSTICLCAFALKSITLDATFLLKNKIVRPKSLWTHSILVHYSLSLYSRTEQPQWSWMTCVQYT